MPIYEIPFGESGILSLLSAQGEISDIAYTPLKEPSLYSFYPSKVLKEDPTIGGYFVEISPFQEAFLPYEQTTEKLKVGDRKILQIVREKVENKPPKVSQKFRFPLCGCLFLKDKTLKAFGTNCGPLEGAAKEFFQKIEAFASNAPLKWSASLTQFLNGCAKEAIFTEKPRKELENIASLLGFTPKINPTSLERLLKLSNFGKNVGKVLNPLVTFEGGNILVQPLKGYTFIDVNGHLNAYLLNKRAAGVVKREIRLRKLGGLIGVDFARVVNRREKQLLKEFLKKTFAPLGCKALGFTNGGVYELLCPKTVPPLQERLTEYNPYCGCGWKRNSLLELEILEKLLPFKGEEKTLKLHPLREELGKRIREKYIGKLKVVLDCSLSPNSFLLL